MNKARKKSWGLRKGPTLILGLFAIVVVLFFLNLLFANPDQIQQYRVYPPASTYSDTPDGGRLLYDLLAGLGFKVQQNRHPLDGYYQGPVDIIWHEGSTMVRIGSEEVAWVDRWVAEGGTLVLVNGAATAEAATPAAGTENTSDALLVEWLGKARLTGTTVDVMHISQSGEMATPHRVPVEGKQISPAIGPLGIVNTYERRTMIGPEVYRFSSLELPKADEAYLAVIRDPYGVVVARVNHGDGTVWLVADPYLFSNLLIQEANNAPLAVSIAMSSRGGESAVISFDEYHLGYVQSRSLSDAARTPIGKAILFLGVVSALAIGTAGARFGRARKGIGPVGVSQRAFVQALAGLWQAADASTAAADALWRRYHSRSSARRRGLDEQLDSMRKGTAKVDELLEVARKLDA